MDAGDVWPQLVQADRRTGQVRSQEGRASGCSPLPSRLPAVGLAGLRCNPRVHLELPRVIAALCGPNLAPEDCQGRYAHPTR